MGPLKAGSSSWLRSSTVKENVNPVWNDEFLLPIPASSSSSSDGSQRALNLHLWVYDVDKLGANDFIGEVTTPRAHALRA